MASSESADELKKIKVPDFHGLSLSSELDTLKQILHVLDEQLKKIDEESKEYFQNPEYIEDMEGNEFVMDLTFWYDDRKESMIALGFVAIQEFMTSVIAEEGFTKPAALFFGLQLTPTLTIAQILNSAANYYKHHDEWPSKRIDLTPQQASTIANIEQFDIDLFYPDHPLTELLNKITESGTAQLSDILPLLDQWGHELLRESSLNPKLRR